MKSKLKNSNVYVYVTSSKSIQILSKNQKNEDLVELRFSTRKQCFSNKNLGIWSLEHYQNREVLIMYFGDT